MLLLHKLHVSFPQLKRFRMFLPHCLQQGANKVWKSSSQYLRSSYCQHKEWKWLPYRFRVCFQDSCSTVAIFVIRESLFSKSTDMPHIKNDIYDHCSQDCHKWVKFVISSCFVVGSNVCHLQTIQQLTPKNIVHINFGTEYDHMTFVFMLLLLYFGSYFSFHCLLIHVGTTKKLIFSWLVQALWTTPTSINL